MEPRNRGTQEPRTKEPRNRHREGAPVRALSVAYDFGRLIGGTIPFTRYAVTSLP